MITQQQVEQGMRVGRAWLRLGREMAAKQGNGIKLLGTIDRIEFRDMNGNVLGCQSRTQNDPAPIKVHYRVVCYKDGREEKFLRGPA